MITNPKSRIRFALALVAGLGFAAGCSSDGDDGTGTGSLTLSINPTTGSAAQGGQTTTAVTVTRVGDFTGTVNLTVTGQPTGVTATVSAPVTTGAVTTATVTIAVAAATVPNTYNLVLHATGTGVTEVTSTYALTVTAAPAAAYALTLSAGTANISPSGNATVTVNLARTNFTGDVALTAEGLPANVTAAFAPNPANGNSSVLTLTAAAGAVLGTTNVTIKGTAAGLTDRTATLALSVVAAAATYTLAAAPAAVTIVAGTATPTVTVNITRTNFPDAVTLGVTGLPTGVTAAFVPAAPTTNSSVLTLTVTGATVPGVYNLTVTGTTATVNQTTPLVLTVTAAAPVGNFTLTTTPATTATVTQGLNTAVTVNLVRTGGNVSNVALTLTGTLPAGLTATFNPTSTTAATSTLTIAATAGVPVGNYPVVIKGNVAGLAEQTVNLSIVVAAPGGSGNVTVSFAPCAVANRAVWVAFQDGTAGAWTRVTGAADVYQFNITQSKGGFAYVVLGAGAAATINVLYFTQAELIAGGFNICGGNLTGTNVTATVANLPVGALGNVSFGGGLGSAFANGPVNLTNVLAGANDVVGYAAALTGPTAADRMFFARGVTPAAGSIGTVDFTGAGSFAPASALITVGGGVGGETMSQGMFYQTGAACISAALYSIGTVTGANFTAYGAPGANQVATDFHRLTLTSLAGQTAFRLVSETFKTLAPRTLTLPAALGAVTATNAGGPYKRPSLVSTFPAELNSSAVATYTDQTVVGKAGTIIATSGWLGGLNVTLVLPDFSALTGWSNAWAAATGDAVQWTLSGSGTNITAGLCQEGGRLATSTRLGTL